MRSSRKKQSPVTREMMIAAMGRIRRAFLKAAAAAQEAEDKLEDGMPWRTDDLADANATARVAVEALRELL